jgi:integrase
MNALEKIDRHIQENLSAGNLSKEEALLMREIVDEYNATIGSSPEWLKNKYHLLFRTIQILHSSTGKGLIEITTPDVIRAVAAMRTAEYSDNYRRQMISAFKWVSKWLAERGHDIKIEKVDKIKLPRPQWKTKTPEDMLTQDEVYQAIDACQNPRDACLVAMLFDASCRSIELLSLTWGSVNFDPRGAKFSTNRKTGYKRDIRLTFSVPYLVKWKDQYPGEPTGNNPVFVTWYKMDGRTRNREMTKDALDRVMIRLRERTGNQKLKPGIFRPSKISADVADGYDLPYVMLKNWGNLKTGMIDLYTNISSDYIDRQALEMAGLEKALVKEKRKDLGKLKPIECPFCEFINVPTAQFCIECGQPITPEARLSFEQKRIKLRSGDEFKDLEDRLQRLEKKMEK